MTLQGFNQQLLKAQNRETELIEMIWAKTATLYSQLFQECGRAGEKQVPPRLGMTRRTHPPSPPGLRGLEPRWVQTSLHT